MLTGVHTDPAQNHENEEPLHVHALISLIGQPCMGTINRLAEAKQRYKYTGFLKTLRRLYCQQRGELEDLKLAG